VTQAGPDSTPSHLWSRCGMTAATKTETTGNFKLTVYKTITFTVTHFQ